MIFNNFYIKAYVELLEVPLPLEAFKKEDGSYYTIPEYLATYGHTVTRYSNDKTMFIKGFGFDFDTIEELIKKLPDFGLVRGENIWIFSEPEVKIELQEPMWNKAEDI